MTTPPHTYPEGVPCWVDLEHPDPRAAARFYGAVLGWRFDEATPPDSAEPYLMATLDGEDVAGIAGGAGGDWITYIAVDDADAAAERIAAAGGTVIDAPVDAAPAGRYAVCTDPGGAVFRIWQADRRPGAQVVNVPGSWNFSVLRTPDPRAALDFYARAFGWTSIGGDPALGDEMVAVPGYGAHLAATVDPGILERQQDAPDGFEDVVAGIARGDGRPRWQVQFTVADRDSVIAMAQELGAELAGEPRETDYTLEATIRDPQGAEFRVAQLRGPE